MTNILVTGAAGFIGSHFIEHILSNTDWNISVIHSLRHKGVLERLTDSIYYNTSKDRVTHYTHDLVSPFSTIMMDRLQNIDYVVNFASESHVDRSITDPRPFVENNVAVALTMLEYARVVQPQAFVQVSTDEVYGPAKLGLNHVEWSTILPSNPYSASKAAQEALAIAYWRTYGINIIITNTMNNIGERQDEEKFVPKIIKRILLGETMDVHGTPGHIGSRYYLHARNHADAILWLLRNTVPTKYPDSDRPDRYNVVGEIELNNLELAEMVSKVLAQPLKYRLVDFHNARPGHDARYALDGAKIATLGWKAPIDFETSLEKTVLWYLDNPEWLGLGNKTDEAIKKEMRWSNRQRGAFVLTKENLADYYTPGLHYDLKYLENAND